MSEIEIKPWRGPCTMCGQECKVTSCSLFNSLTYDCGCFEVDAAWGYRLSTTAFARDWDRPEEDEAWKDL